MAILSDMANQKTISNYKDIKRQFLRRDNYLRERKKEEEAMSSNNNARGVDMVQNTAVTPPLKRKRLGNEKKHSHDGSYC